MKRKSIKSSNIEAIGYDIEKQILEVEFKGRSVYYYKAVGLKTVVELVFAESVGSYFNKNVKTKFDYVKGEYNG